MKFNKIFEAFPPPKFLDIPFAGLSIGDTHIRCIQFRRKGGHLYIDKYKELAVSPGAISSGQINQKEELIVLLQTLKKDLNLSYVKVSLPEEKAYLFTSKTNIIKPEEVLDFVESKIEENVPVPSGELIFDYKTIDHRQKGHLDIIVSSIPISVVDVYLEVIEKAGLSLLSLEIESQAIVRALLEKRSIGTSLIVNFNKEKVGLYVVTDRVVRFTSTIVTRGESSGNLDFLSQEIKKLFIYWHTLKDNVDKPEKKINQIIVCGENFPDTVIQYFSTHNKIKTLVGNVWINVFDINKVVPEIPLDDSLKYAASIGLALPGDNII